MKAAVLDKYDKNGKELTVKDIPVPEISADDVLVKALQKVASGGSKGKTIIKI